MFRSLLIANRGEIACRIIRTARRLGLRTIAVHSDADEDALHVCLADHAVRIGEGPASLSYLRAEAIVEAGRSTGAEAIHPGYGFLSERAILPRLCEGAGIAFVGPSADIIEIMGSKIGAKEIAARAGVASVPGYSGADQSTARLRQEALRIGLPVMVKASAGGGGKGMRRVFEASGLEHALDMARREAQAAFGDPSLLLERLVQRPRHLEVQVAGDRHGNLVHLFERDCSVQRANQKLLEEAPAPNLDPAIRERLISMGLAVAREVGYDNLGTVEFILEDGRSEPWFLEMNTRLQVEHTVTEEITGLDLVEWQLRIAAGETLPLGQDDIVCSGAAIEARVNAERPDQDFQPDAGPIRRYREPSGVRVDSGVAAGSLATPFYDSMLAKVIARGATREEARARLKAALHDFDVAGPATNIDFLADAVAHPIFRQGRATTDFIEDAFFGRWQPRGAHAVEALAAAALLAAGAGCGAQRERASAWSGLRGFRTLGPAGIAARSFVRLLPADEAAPVVVEVMQLGASRYRVAEGGRSIDLRFTVDGERIHLGIDAESLAGRFVFDADAIQIKLGGETHAFRVVADDVASAAARDEAGTVTAPMPGIVSQVNVAEGDPIEAHTVLAVLESMKLFVPVRAKGSGIVSRIAVRPGDSVTAGDTLVVVDAPRQDRDQQAPKA